MHDDLHNHAGSALGTTLPSVRNAQDLLQRDYERLRPIVGRIVGSRLRNAVGWVDEAVVDAAYNQAWHAVYLKLAEGESIDDLSALLVTITHRRAIDDLRTQHWDRQANEALDDQRSFEQDLDAQLDDQVRLQHAFEAMRDKLNQRERHAAVLCYVLGHSRPEAAVQLGVSRKRMEKIMDGVSGKLAQLTPGLGSRQWCRERAGLIRSYALGLLDPESERYAQASQHLEGCAACRRQVLVVRGLGAIVPPWPLLILLKSSLVAGAGAGAGAAASSGAAAAPAASSASGPWSTVLGNIRPATVVGAVATATVVAAVAAAAITQPAFLGGDNAKNEGAATAQANVAPATPGSGAGSGSSGGAGSSSSASASKAAKKPAKKAKASPSRASSGAAATAAAGSGDAPSALAAAPSTPVEPASIEPSGTDAADPATTGPGSPGADSGGAAESGGSPGSSGSSGSPNGSSGSSKPDRPSKPQPSKPPQPDKLPVAKPPVVVPPVVVPPVATPPVAVPPVTTPTPPTTPPAVDPPVVPPVDPPLDPPVDPPDECTLLVNGVCVIP